MAADSPFFPFAIRYYNQGGPNPWAPGQCKQTQLQITNYDIAPPFQNGANNRDPAMCFAPSTFMCWVQNTSRIQTKQGVDPVSFMLGVSDQESSCHAKGGRRRTGDAAALVSLGTATRTACNGPLTTTVTRTSVRTSPRVFLCHPFVRPLRDVAALCTHPPSHMSDTVHFLHLACVLRLSLSYTSRVSYTVLS